MALNASVLSLLIQTEMRYQGFNIDNEHCSSKKLATAIANAVVAHIQTDSVLIPLATDSGTAGAGIIAGKVG